MDTRLALKKLQGVLKRWNREVFGDVQRRKEKLLSEILEVQKLIENNPSDELLQKESSLMNEFDVALEQEEIIWYQKSREKLLTHGDRNTKFFHTSTIIRRRKNKIEMLKNAEGQWLTDEEELEKLAITYYKRLYSLDDVEQSVETLPRGSFATLSHADKRDLQRPFTADEIETAIRSMGSFKAPGPDGFQPVFYQRCWDTVGSSVIQFVLDFFRTGELPQNTNNAVLVLIAKVVRPERIMQFRPISLCNVLFKTITKTLVGRMKGIMNKIIGPAQSSSLPGRLTTDNIVVVQEAVHSMRRKKGRKGWMLLKLDLEKAFDRIRWDFLEDTLQAAGFPDNCVGWIMQCVTGPSMSLLWNGEMTDSFQPLRGLRQGDPLSPYLFVLCMERLCHLIERAVVGKNWKPIQLSRGGPQLSHILFADDLILFAEASVAQIRVIRGVLERFCIASGQKVNLEKSKIFFSSNVSRELGRMISNESGIQSTCDLGKYLGMPVLQKRINKDTFGEVLERASSRLTGWKSCTLSFAGRLTLTKSVLSSIPVHTMSTIMLPQSTLDSLDRLARNFLWGSSSDRRKLHLVAWDKVCQQKSEGGLGIRRSKEMNKALIAKVGWRVMHNTHSLWAQVVRKKYHVGDLKDTRWMIAKGTWSSTWRSVGLGLRDVVVRGQRWVLGDGRQIKFWADSWLTDEPLLLSITSALPQGLENTLIKDLWQAGSGWDFENIAPYLAEDKKT